MKIAYVIPNSNPSHGGEQRDAFDSAVGLSKLGHDVSIFSRSLPRELPEGVAFFKIPVSRLAGRHLRDQLFLRGVRFAIREQGPFDIVESFSRCALGTVYRVGQGLRANYHSALKPYRPNWRSSLESFLPKDLYYQALERKVFTECEHFIANSKRTAQEFADFFTVDPERIHVIYPSVDTDRFSPEMRLANRLRFRTELRISPPDFVLGFVGSGFERKGLREAIDIMASLRSGGFGCKLLVAGKGSTATYRRYAQELGVAENCLFLGPREDIESVYSAIDVLLLPSRFEPFGLAPLEAMSCGIPAVVSANCGIAEVLQHQSQGYIIADEESLAGVGDYIGDLIGDSALYKSTSRKSRIMAMRYGQERYCKELLNVYNLARKGGYFSSSMIS